MNLSDILRNMVDGEVIMEASAITIGAGLSALFYYFHSGHESMAKRVKKTPKLNIDEHLLSSVKNSNGQYLPYVAVSGKVSSFGEVLRSRYFPDKEGVILNFVTEEKKETWAKYTHVWQETEKEVANITDTVPFGLTDRDNIAVHVVDPLQSTWCMNSLDVVNKEFRTPNSTIMDSILGIVSGDRIKGYTDTEKMLRVGTQLLGIGELFVEDDIVKLRKPPKSVGDFIITRSTQEGVVSQIRFKAKLWRVLYLMLLGATATGLFFVIKRWWRKYRTAIADVRRQEEIKEIRRQRSRARAAGNASDRTRNSDDDKCVVCLTNPRECVILDCGHICACVDCMEAIPYPKLCPMCRGRVEKLVPLFYA